MTLVVAGWGKSYVFIGMAVLSPPGKTYRELNFNSPGSMILVIPSITTLQNQLEADARGLGISVVNLNKVTGSVCMTIPPQVQLEDVQVALKKRPQIVLVNIDLLADRAIQVFA